VKVLEDRVVAIAQGQANAAKSLHATADDLLVHTADDGGATARSLHEIADALDSLARELAMLGDSFRMVIAETLGDDSDTR